MPLINYDRMIVPMQRNIKMINAARRLRGRQHEKFYRLPTIEDRMDVRDRFIHFLGTEVIVIPESVEILGPLLSQRSVMITPTRTRKRDFRPSPMGNVATVGINYDIASIEAKRFFNVYATNLLTKEELEKTELSGKDYERWLSTYKMKKNAEGFKFSSPSGRPQMKMWNNRVFSRPMSFSFQVDVQTTVFTNKGFTYKGELYQDFKPTWWSDFDFEKAEELDARLAFGMAKRGNEFFMFYADSRTKTIERKLFPYNSRDDYYLLHDRDFKWYCPLKRNFGIITTYRWLDFKPSIDFSANLTGDHEAVLNYGNFFNSSNLRAHNIMSGLFRKFRSYMPKKLILLKQRAPIFFRTNVVEIERGATTVLIGNKSVCLLKLIHTDKPEILVKIDCTGDFPIKLKNEKSTRSLGENVWNED